MVDSRIKHLSERIHLVKEKSLVERKDLEVVDFDLDFRLGDLLTDLIYASKLQYRFPTKSDLVEFHGKYPKNKGIMLETLFDKYWLREVMNRIEIPYAVKKASQVISEGFPSEFNFIKKFNEYLQFKEKSSITKNEILDIITELNSIQPATPLKFEDLKDKGVYYTGFSFEDYQLHPHAQQLLLIHREKNQFEFIAKFLKKFSVNGNAKYYSISVGVAKKICKQHRISYSKCPTLEELIEQKLFLVYKGNYIFKLSYGNHADWWNSLGDLISGKLWAKLKNDETFQNDSLRLDCWLDKIQINSDYPSFCVKKMPNNLRAEFIELLGKRILDENDLIGSAIEIDKISLEQSYSQGRYPLIDKIQLGFNDNQSAAEKYRLFMKVDRDLHNLFHDQSSRQRIDILVHILIRESNAFENSTLSFQSIFKLLESSANRPYLVWQISTLITYIRPEIIPYLFLKKNLQELGVLLLSTIRLNQYAIKFGDREDSFLQGEELRSKINEEALLTLLHSISDLDSKDAAQVLAKTIIEISKQIYYYPNNLDLLKQKTKQIQINAFQQTWELIARFRIEKTQFVHTHGKDRPLFIFYLLNDFVNEIISYKDEEAFNEYYTPDIWRIDSLIRLLKIILDPALIQKNLYQKNYQDQITELETSILDKIHSVYNTYFSIEKINVRSGPLSELKLRELKFQSKTYGLELVPWKTYIELLDTTQRNDFFHKSFPKFEVSNIQSTEKHHFSPAIENLIQRTRFHFKVMLNAYFAIIDDDIIDKDLVGELEKHITHIFCTFSKTVRAENKIDIFDKNYDSNSNENLFVRLIEATNTFTTEKRNKILDTLIANDQFERILAALNILVSQGDRAQLLTSLTDVKLNVFLENQTFYFDIQNALVHSINNVELATYAEKIIMHIEKNHSKIGKDYEQRSLLYHVKLLLAYRKGDIATLQKIETPKDGYDDYSGRRLTDNSRRKYYEIILLHEKKDFDNSLNQAEILASQRKDDPVILNLQFSLNIENAKRKYDEDTDKGKHLIKKALDLFNSSIKDCNRDLLNDSINSDILFNKLVSFNLLEQNANFDFHYSQIRKTYKFTKQFACLIVENKIKRKQLTEASIFIEELINYHRQRSGLIPDFIEGLRNDLSSHKEHIEYLRQAYKDILCLSEGQRIKTLPEVITVENKNFDSFLLGELSKAIVSLQEKVYSLVKDGEKVNDIDEDKITDILELILNARLSAWQMQWFSQSRSGTTGKITNQLARPDLSILNSNTKYILEALRIYSYKSVSSLKSSIESHVIKTFDATSTRKAFYNLVYFQSTEFDSSWTEFKDIINAIQFPDRFKRTTNLEELPLKSTSDFKVAFTEHEKEVVCYYLFVNLDPSINT